MSDEEYVGGNFSQIQIRDNLFDQIVKKVVRSILALNSNNTVITRANLQKLAWEEVSLARVNFSKVLAEADYILKDVYGFELYQLPKKEMIDPNTGKKKESSTQGWILINGITDPHLKFALESQWDVQSLRLFQSELGDQNEDYRNNKLKYPTLGSDEQLVLNGFAIVVMSIIIIEGNHILEHELMRYLSEYLGISVTRPLDVLNLLPVKALELLDKYEYVVRNVTKGEVNHDENVEYSIGRRGKVEFNRDAFIQLMRIIYDENPTDETSSEDAIEREKEFLKMISATLVYTFGPEEIDQELVNADAPTTQPNS
ncbi:hypothetical protein WICMUC_005068 [Wickerhamomyces mucosus]|uniref:MAGE domain-containing protein n=1 Tax=Wickerhamomyces mucosus TaxID=1378264 RepID=A0A9P8PD64_9ASCO|nr:hypothetical protein WICMUC_005068 [Wickerhamomyces mucosus]